MSYRNTDLVVVFAKDPEEVLLHTIQKAMLVAFGLTMRERTRVMEIIVQDSAIGARAANLILDQMLIELRFDQFGTAAQLETLLDNVAALASES